MSGKRPFRVIVVGAGIGGLTLSNALQRAGIDHVVLEKHRQVVYPSGASIGVWPNGSRLLSQLGCLELAKGVCAPMKTSLNRTSDGKVITVSKLFDEIIKRHGYEYLLLERQEFVRALYDGLPSKEPVKTECAVTDIIESEHGVRVLLDNGSSEDGDIVVGSDGVASSVRRMMWDKANSVAPNSIGTAEMRALKTRYKCLVGLSPSIPGFPTGIMAVVHHDGFSFLLFTQPEKTFFFVFIHLDTTYYWPLFPKYTKQDAEREASKLLNFPVHDGVVFGDIWEKRLRGELVNIEEGIAGRWHSGRIVLLGDAVHKFTPNTAFGGNSAMDSAATLANLLRQKLVNSPDGLSSHPGQSELSAIFQSYQEKRQSPVRYIGWFSTLMTRVAACENALFKFMAIRVFPLASDALVADMFAWQVKRGVKLDYVPLVDAPRGTVKFDDDRGEESEFMSKDTMFWFTGMAVVCWAVSMFVLSREKAQL
ncbi:FAD/NAD(P)-binding domain-containing protein [Sodiomyces alkalinus F11]|uniref:FAD/NAD(P)-binding domain-containing protein n=1 Tax=Sodiomyces alkalinus (strain CBS 110278 / VKM F-3762 / F11) TaxID=1314773 RepID=A0A3N2Q2X3_SODAK|nr:FAD/NAD(P)-binding domain-containing protein [Sodiomyces alkalinus F11]ROT41103.1 FAD/NAD(P)-binding domain-containing protein [Sodiomyces alkalinus F11]